MVVLDQRRIPLVGLAADEAVKAVIAEAQRPVLAVGADVERIDGHVVVLAHPERAPTGVTEHRRDRRVLGRDVTGVAGKSCRGVGGGSGSALVVVWGPQPRWGGG